MFIETLKHDAKSTFVKVEALYTTIIVLFNMFHIYIEFALYGHHNQFPPKNLVGRFLSHDRVLERITRFYNPKLK